MSIHEKFAILPGADFCSFHLNLSAPELAAEKAF